LKIRRANRKKAAGPVKRIDMVEKAGAKALADLHAVMAWQYLKTEHSTNPPDLKGWIGSKDDRPRIGQLSWQEKSPGGRYN